MQVLLLKCETKPVKLSLICTWNKAVLYNECQSGNSNEIQCI